MPLEYGGVLFRTADIRMRPQKVSFLAQNAYSGLGVPVPPEYPLRIEKTWILSRSNRNANVDDERDYSMVKV